MITNYKYWKIIPSGNPTIFLKADEIPQKFRSRVANFVLNPRRIGAEQVGFIHFGESPRMDMMGGEFCLNATRSFALLLAMNGYMEKNGEQYFGEASVSGFPTAVKVHVVLNEKLLPYSEVCLSFSALPVPERIFFEEEGNDSDQKLFLVRLPGITHLIFKEWENPLTDKFCRELCADLQLFKESAVGFIQVSGEHSEQEHTAFTVKPIVWVRDTETLCHETACGSGTLAAALAEYAWSGITEYSVLQPSGEKLNLRIEQSDQKFDVWVGGVVHIESEGFTDLSEIMA